jgi:hypothetical protein
MRRGYFAPRADGDFAAIQYRCCCYRCPLLRRRCWSASENWQQCLLAVRTAATEDDLAIKRGQLVWKHEVRADLAAAIAHWNRATGSSVRQAGRDMNLPEAMTRAFLDRVEQTQRQFVRDLQAYAASQPDPARPPIGPLGVYRLPNPHKCAAAEGDPSRYEPHQGDSLWLGRGAAKENGMRRRPDLKAERLDYSTADRLAELIAGLVICAMSNVGSRNSNGCIGRSWTSGDN